MFQQKLQKKLYHFHWNSPLRSVMQNMIQMDFRSQTKNPIIKLSPMIVRISTSTPTKNLQLLVTPTLQPKPKLATLCATALA